MVDPHVAARRIEEAATAERAVRTATRAAAGVGVPGILAPGLDEAAMYTIWLAMITTVAKRTGASLSPASAAKLVASALGGAAAYTVGSKVLTWGVLAVLAAVPVAALPAAMGMNAAINALLTWRLGRACTQRFADPRFGARDALVITRDIFALPGVSEILDLKRLLGVGT
jgi:uncharacterized protein (DUF697 family)